MSIKSRRAYASLPKVRKILRELPDELTKALKTTFAEGAEEMAQQATANVVEAGLIDSGELVRSMKAKTSRDGLTAKVGIVGQRDNKLVWYGHFHEFGTRGCPEKNIPPLPAQHFLGRAFDQTKQRFGQKIADEVDRALDRASQGKK
ncbi:HK97-gp10 family putative phage morphogenesis protein [Pararhodospirillum photometricum]